MRIARICSYGLGVLLAVHALGGAALGGVIITTPEIDGSAVTAGLGLLAAGVLMLRARKSR